MWPLLAVSDTKAVYACVLRTAFLLRLCVSLFCITIDWVYSHSLSPPPSFPLFLISHSLPPSSLSSPFTHTHTLSLSSSHRSAFLPYQISPCSITNTGFKLGSTDFTLTIQIATGQKGLGRNTILNNARKIQDNLAVMECSLLYSNSFCLPYCPLCAHSLAVNDACQMLLPRK